MSAPGWEWESASRATSSFSVNRLETVTWSRRRSAVSGSVEERGAGAGAGSVGGGTSGATSCGRTVSPR